MFFLREYEYEKNIVRLNHVCASLLLMCIRQKRIIAAVIWMVMLLCGMGNTVYAQDGRFDVGGSRRPPGFRIGISGC